MAATALFAVPESASAQVFWGWGPRDYYQEQRPVRPKRAKVKPKADPAEAQAKNAAKPEGPLVIAVSVEKQRVRVYDSNGLFAEAPVSTGTKSHPTPMGVFSIIQKNRHHVSNLYGASMPYMQRITWSGVAMHTGPLPGYAASHGCIRLPNEFAARLWVWTRMGTRVIVAPGEVAPKNFTHAKLVTKMVPLPTVSAAPAAAQVAAQPASPTPIQRTADARQAIAGMKGTLTDVPPAAPMASTRVEAETAGAKPAEASIVETKAVEGEAVESTAKPVEPQAANPIADAAGFAAAKLAGAAAGSQPLDAAAARAERADVKAEAKPVQTAQASAEKAAAKDELAVKPEDRNNNDDSEEIAATAEPAPKAKDAKPAEPKSVAAPVEAKPAQPALDIAKPADIIKPSQTKPAKPTEAKPADAAKPADVTAPVAVPEPPKPVVTATPRRHNHVAVFISRKDKKLYIRHGYEPIYDTPIEITDADRPLGTHVFTARADKNDAQALEWSVVSVPVLARTKAEPKRSRHAAKAAKAPAPVQQTVIPTPSAAEALDRIAIPQEALEKIASIITPGGSLLISDYGLTGWETGKGTDFIVPLRQ